MTQMILLNNVRSFFRKNPAYEPDMVELSAVIYILSCKMIGVQPTGCLVPTVRNCHTEKRCTAQKQHPRQQLPHGKPPRG